MVAWEGEGWRERMGGGVRSETGLPTPPMQLRRTCAAAAGFANKDAAAAATAAQAAVCAAEAAGGLLPRHSDSAMCPAPAPWPGESAGDPPQRLRREIVLWGVEGRGVGQVGWREEGTVVG